jgi:hypothetical protein
MMELSLRSDELDQGLWTPDCAAGLRLAMEDADSWDRLGELCAEADQQYQDGLLTLGQTEDLAELAVVMARSMEAEHREQAPVVASDLLEGAPVTCPACGNDSWWHNQGDPVCSVCHPHPGLPAAAARNAA